MSTCLLTLQPYGKNPFSLRLSENDGRKRRVEQIIHNSNDRYIFSDVSYEFMLSFEETMSVGEVQVYINDVYEPSVYHHGRISFPGKSASDRRIFIDCYGFVEIFLVVFDGEGNEHQYATEYLPVLVRRGELNNAVKAMVSYVYSHQESLLLNGEPMARSLANLKERGRQNFSAQIILAQEIATIYESSYGYFKANSCFKIKKISKIARFEQLQQVTPATVQFIAMHPEELHQGNSYSGIRIGSLFYQPEKTLSIQNECSYDTYENRVVLGFIKKMIDSINQLYEHGRLLLDKIPENENYGDEYIYSSFVMFSETKRMLESGLNQLAALRSKFTHLWTIYSSILKINPEAMINEPRSSHIFMSVPQYNRIFVQIHKWFYFGMYDFSQERFMLSFIKISSLYEGYILAKIVAYFDSRGYDLIDVKKCVYPIKHNWKYKNTDCNNTFFFKNGKYKVTLYYQPVIYDTDQSSINGIGLLRNNSIPSWTGDIRGGHYYSPDYVIKVEDECSTRYIILDAKFSDLVCVRKYHMKDLAFKYLFSISPIQPKDFVVGLGVFYGKCNASERVSSAYDKSLPNQKITPVAEIFPIIEGISNDDQYSKLDVLMRILI